MFRYLLCGRAVDSDIALPLLPCPPDQPHHLSLRVDSGCELVIAPALETEVVAEAHGDDGTGLTHVRTRQGYRLKYSSYCEADLSAHLNEVVVRLTPGRDEEYAALFLVGGISAFMLSLQGRPPLHGSAVCRAGRTLGFLGGSGAGKSTLAALYCLDGAHLLADDLLALDADSRVLPGTAELRLRPAAEELAKRFPQNQVRWSIDGRFAVRCASSAQDPLPLSALIAPVLSADALEVSIKRMSGAQAFLALASSPRQLGLKDTALIEAAFAHFAEIARRTPVFEAVIPIERLRDPSLPRELDQKLELLL